ncbi:hypothetical protein [Phyllobacterium endophyticum]|uniref:Uncharacterized protein n=1 Tax=Phyllobacterium endophyticum TaxID=1149773 RepID=A0A2P7AUX1_9HYPH|nr:hypothetical protein [Phyllobacterium endophyticum]MBB3234540.1 hypothetical protein [Phyllobacterium endophyticum]PSH58024.1 hypothetical protein CU100_10175 [Phyllobacterium endophyticum]TYR38692.1 hypothetical protein FY050_22135 [Phyllobacterium endophyticum]
MNWRKGFFRAWIAFSVVWAASFVLIMYPEINQPHADISTTGYLINPNTQELGTFEVTSKEYPLLVRDKNAGKLQVVKMEGLSWAEIYVPFGSTTDTINTYVDRIHPIAMAEEKNAAEAKRWRNVTDTIAMSLSIPIAVLLIGLALGWVVNGFRSRA